MCSFCLMVNPVLMTSLANWLSFHTLKRELYLKVCLETGIIRQSLLSGRDHDGWNNLVMRSIVV
uniref:Uncharacterized protein n=1 Tax=Octopus bimaculoides TaxID=37653 RepID=A0A0L8FTQ8_OCTBM